MTQTIEAIYQNGMFKPLTSISQEITEGEKVKLAIDDERLTPEEMLELAGQFYERLSDEDVEEIERIALDRSNFFGENPHRILEMLDGICENNIHDEIDFGKPVGKEIWWIMTSSYAVNNFQPDSSGFPRFAGLATSIYGVE